MMTRPRSRLALLCAAALVASLPTAAAAQTTALTFRSEPGDPVGKGISQTWSNLEAAFSVSRNVRNGISVRVDGGSAFWWYLDFSLPSNREITAGYYTGAMRYPFTPFVGMSVYGSGIGCNALTGRYLVREVTYGPGGEVLQFAVDVEQHCEDGPAALFAALRFNSSVPPDLFPADTARYSLAMSVSPGGLVTGGGLACGGAETACSTSFNSVSGVTLAATPAAGYLFNGWSGGCSGGATTTVAVNTVKECAASFTPAVPAHPRTRLAFAASGASEEVHTFANSRWSLSTANEGNDLTFRVEGLGAKTIVEWRLELRAPAGGTLQAGYFPNAVRAAVRTTTPGLDFVANGAGCGTVSGEFTVHQYVRNPATGEVIAFAADFLYRCGGPAAAPLAGRIEYWATYQVPSTCQTPDPFAAMGGGTCYAGGWLPPGMPVPGAAAPTAPPAPEPPPIPAPPSTPSACSTPDPFAALGGGTCYDGGWLPPGMPVPGGAVTPPPAPPTPPPPAPPPAPTTGCSSPDPFASLGGGTCYNGGWLPPGMPIPGGGGVSPVE
jgi:hypothetical protein